MKFRRDKRKAREWGGGEVEEEEERRMGVQVYNFKISFAISLQRCGVCNRHAFRVLNKNGEEGEREGDEEILWILGGGGRNEKLRTHEEFFFFLSKRTKLSKSSG